MSYKSSVIEKIERINELLNELQYCEINQFISIQKNQSTIIQKINKLQEYNEIDDMNNAIVGQKLQQIYEKI